MTNLTYEECPPVKLVLISNVLCDFLEVAIHNILFNRHLYPSAIFKPCKKYGIIVQQSQHPALNEYIAQTLKAVQVHANNSQLKQLILCIQRDQLIIEKYVFDVLQLEPKIADTDRLLTKLQQHLRSLCLQLASVLSNLSKLPTEAEFSIVLHTTEYSAEMMNVEHENHDFPWISTINSNSESLGIMPLHTIDTDNLVLQLYLETLQ